jgi:hypothetical protein
VVLEDDTYKGQLKIGFKFIANVSFDSFFFLKKMLGKLIICLSANTKMVFIYIAERKVCDEESRIHCCGETTKTFNLGIHLENIMVEILIFL